MKKTLLFTLLLVQSAIMVAQTTLTLGTGTSNSATRGPFQRSDTGSGSVYSRAIINYNATELSSLTSSATISQINFDLGSENVITATGNATMDIYMKNSTATQAPANSTLWADVISGFTLVGTYTFNTTNNFPGVKQYVNFVLATNFNYTGNALDVAVEWNCSALVPLDPLAPNQLFSGNGSLNWNWTATTLHSSLNVNAGASGPPSSLTNLKAERVNTQLVHTAIPLSVKDVLASKLNIYPNPASDYITIKSNSVKLSSVELYNVLGSRVLSAKTLNNDRLNISGVSKGIYMLKVNAEGASSTKKIVIE